MKRIHSLIIAALLICLAPFTASAQTETEGNETATVTINYTSNDARKALEMIFNVTQLRSISYESIESFEVNKGDKVRFVFNTKDYDVTFNGEQVEPSKDKTTGHVVTITDNTTCTISATDREYGTTTVSLWTNDIDGLVLREGTIDGPIVSESSITLTGTVEYGFGSIDPNTKKYATLNVYDITVSSKSPKVFVSEAKGYWIEASEFGPETDYMSASVTSEDNTLRVLCNKLVADKRLVVYLSVDGTNVTEDGVLLRDNNRKEYPLTAGYNEFLIDTRYSKEFTAAAYSNNGTEPLFSYYCDMAGISKNKETEQYTVDIDDDALLHIFAGRPAPAQCTITADISPEAAATTTILVDRFTMNGTTVKTFKGCEVSVTPGSNLYYLDGETPDYEGDTHTFLATGSHEITVGKSTGITETSAYASGDATVTTIDGRVIRKDADANMLESLPRGIYIVNGKKVIN